MDERQTKIVAGAGLEESRLNTDFIDFLRKWGSHLLLIVAGVAAAYSALMYWERHRARKLDEAYAQLSAAQTAGSPDNLLRVAREHAAQGAVRELATIAAGNAFLTSGWSGVAPGGDPSSADDRLSDEQRRQNYERAKQLFAEVIGRVGRDQGMTLHLLDAKFGFAAASASLGEAAAAETALKEAASVARERHYPALAKMAEDKIAAMARSQSMPRLYSADEVRVAERRASGESSLSFPTVDLAAPSLPPVAEPAPEPAPEAPAPTEPAPE
ncbi:MAG: hypothetical protein IBJ10_08795 [Phycisphaerales bacterium]|nr:hypothetical protein [Phycisphaerales bacterium]